MTNQRVDSLDSVRLTPDDDQSILGSSPETLPEVAKRLDLIQRSKHVAQLAIALAEISPANEIIRGAAFGAGEILSRNPLMGAATLGLSTLVVEGVGAKSSRSFVANRNQ